MLHKIHNYLSKKSKKKNNKKITNEYIYIPLCDEDIPFPPSTEPKRDSINPKPCNKYIKHNTIQFNTNIYTYIYTYIH